MHASTSKGGAPSPWTPSVNMLTLTVAAFSSAVRMDWGCCLSPESALPQQTTDPMGYLLHWFEHPLEDMAVLSPRSELSRHQTLFRVRMAANHLLSFTAKGGKE